MFTLCLFMQNASIFTLAPYGMMYIILFFHIKIKLLWYIMYFMKEKISSPHTNWSSSHLLFLLTSISSTTTMVSYSNTPKKSSSCIPTYDKILIKPKIIHIYTSDLYHFHSFYEKSMWKKRYHFLSITYDKPKHDVII